MPSLPLTIGKRMRALREAFDLNYRQLAEAAGLYESVIWRLENGEFKEPSVHKLTKIATALQTTLDYLVGRSDQPTGHALTEVDPGAAELLAAYQSLTPERQRTLRSFAQFLREQ